MCRVVVLLVGFLAISRVQSVEHIESELAQLPKIQHIDDYEKCLEEKDGIFCHGQFQIYSEVEDHPTFSLIEKYAQDEHLFNRTYLYHGYCLNKRCPSSEQNVTARFEFCVDKWARYRHSLRARLLNLHYCQEHGQPPTSASDTQDLPHRVFLYFVYFIIFANFVGTVYDFTSNDQPKNKLLTMWSVRENWTKLIAPYQEGDPRQDKLEGLNGFKMFLELGAIAAHVAIVAAVAPQHNPRFLEKYIGNIAGPMLGALTTCTQSYLIIANFLFTYNILLASQKSEIGIKMFPVFFLKRVIRILPMYLLLNGYAATWWTSAGSGPLMPLIIGRESAVCRRKFWITAVFLQNFIDAEHICLVQTWIMAVDMQLHVLILAVTLLLVNRRRWALPILSALLVAALAVTTYVALAGSHRPMVYNLTPDNFRNLFRDDRTFVHFFINPINCVFMSIAGTTLAFYHMDCQERGVKFGKVIQSLHYLPLPLFFIWAYHAYRVQGITDPTLLAAMMPIERIVYCALSTFMCFGLVNFDSPLTAFFRWRVLRPLIRQTLAVSMVHWCVNAVLVANRYTAQDTSKLGLVTDTIATFVISRILALPLTILVEFPLQKTMDYGCSYYSFNKEGGPHHKVKKTEL